MERYRNETKKKIERNLMEDFLNQQTQKPHKQWHGYECMILFEL